MDLVEIGFKINSKQVATAVDRVDKLLDKSKKLATETEKTSKKVKQSNDAVVNSNQKKLSTIEKEIAVTKKAQELEKQGLTKAQARKVATHEYTGALKSQIKALIDVYKEQNKANASIKKSIEVTDNSAKSTLREAASIQRVNAALKDKITTSSLVNSLMKEGFNKTQAVELASLKLAKADQSLINTRKQQIVSYNALKASKNADMLASKKVIAMSAKNAKQIERETYTLKYLQEGYSKTTATKMANAKISGVTSTEVKKLGEAAKATENYANSQHKLRLSTKSGADVMSNFFFSFKLAIIAAAVVKLTQLADQMTLLRNRIKLVSKETADLNKIQKDLLKISNDNRSGMVDTITLYTRLTPALKAIGRGTEEVKSLTNAFQKTLLISGATARETSSSILQFSQAMASGKLAGDEFRSMSEAAPRLLKAIADGSEYAKDELKKMSAEGMLTTALVSSALLNQFSELEAESLRLGITLSQAGTILKNNFTTAISDVNEEFGLTNTLAKITMSIARNIGSVIRSVASVFNEYGDAIQVVSSLVMGHVIASKLMVLWRGREAIVTATASTALGVHSIVLKGGVAMMTAYNAMTATSTATTSVFAKVTAGATAGLIGLRAAITGVGLATAMATFGLSALAGAAAYFITDKITAGLNSTSDSLDMMTEKTRNYKKLIADMKGEKVEENVIDLPTDSEIDNLTKKLKELKEEQMGYSAKDADSDEFRALTEEIGKRGEFLESLATYQAMLNKENERAQALGVSITDLRYDENELENLRKKLKLLKETGSEEITNLRMKGVSQKNAETELHLLQQIAAQNSEEQSGKDLKMAEEKLFQLENIRNEAEAEVLAQTRINMLTGEDLKQRMKLLDVQKKIQQLMNEFSSDKALQIERLKLQLMKDGRTEEEASLIANARINETGEKALQLDLQRLKAVKSITDFKRQQDTTQDLENAQAELALIERGYVQEQAKNMIKLQNGEITAKELEQLSKIAELQEKISVQLDNQKVLKDIMAEQAEYDNNPFKELAEFDFSTIFGDIGNPFSQAIQGASEMVDELDRNSKAMKVLDARRKKLEKSGGDLTENDAKRAKLQRKNVKDELKGTANVVGATKNMFKEKTVAFKLLANVERGYRMMELSMSIAAMSQKQAETANAVANDTVVAGSSATASLASSMVGLPFPLNLAAFAATGALLASIGLFGGGSGSSSSGGITLEDRQEAQSTGGVLGSSTTKTESITKSFDLMTNYMSDTVKATSGTFREVSKLNNSIGNLGSALFKGLNFQDGLIEFNEFSGYSNKAGKTLGGLGDSRSLKGIASLGMSELPLVGDFIGGAIGDTFSSLGEGLFGKTKMKKVNEGIQIAGDSFASIMEQGAVDAFAWANIKIKKKSWFKSSTKYKTITQGLSSGIESAFGEIIGGIYTSIEEAVKVLGFGDMSKAVFEGLKISTKGMSDEDALAEIQAAFANVADTTVLQVLPSMTEFQKTGEALAETLMRVATQTTVFSDYLDVLGMTRLQGTVSEDRAFYNYWTQQEDTRTVDVKVNLRDTKYAEEFAKFSDELAEAAGGLEPFTEGLSNLLDVMLTDAQQFERVENALSEGLKGFSNYSWLDTVIYKLPETREGLDALQKKMLETGDTEAFAWLLNNAEMIGDYYDQLEDYASTAYDFDTSFGLNDGLDPLKDALKGVGKDFESVKEVAESTGKEGLGELFKSLTDVQKTALEPFIDTILELVPAVEDVEKTIKSFQDVSMKIRDYLEKLKVSPDSGTPVDIAQEALKQYRELVEKAKGGDLEAAQALTGSASTLIKLSKDAYASGAIFQDIYSEIKSSLGDVADMADVASIEQLNYNVSLAQLGKLHEISEYMKNGTTPWIVEPEPTPEPVVPELDFSGMDFGNIGVIDFGNMGFGLGGFDLSGWNGTIDLGLGTMFAKGGVFTNSIVDTATPFNMGVMGEAGPEAIMPLSRASNGELGVRVVSGGGTDTSPIVAEIQGSNKNLQALVRLQQASNQRILEKLDSIDNRLEGVEEKTRLQARI